MFESNTMSGIALLAFVSVLTSTLVSSASVHQMDNTYSLAEHTTGRCPPGFLHYVQNDRCYLIKELRGDELNYREAHDVCRSKGVFLASFETADELQFVGSHFIVKGTYHFTSGIKVNNTFYWITGEVLDVDDPEWIRIQSIQRDCVGAMFSDYYNMTTLGSMRCKIQRGFVCEGSPVSVAGCSSGPCLNGALCENSEDGYTCLCAAGFNGGQCEQDIDECVGWPCMNGASCINGRGRYSCVCPIGFTGEQCHIVIGDCSDHLCQNEAECMSRPNGYTCSCVGNFTGTYCETAAGDPCPMGFLYYEGGDRCYFIEERGDRQVTPGVAESACQSKHSKLAHLETPEELQFVGSLFKTTGYHILGAMRENDDILYWHQGAVLPNNGTEWAFDEPKEYDDCVAAMSRNQNTKLHTMRCWYARPYVCEKAPRLPPCEHSCRSTPCLHGAMCVNVNETYTCVCPRGFSGRHCETDANECLGDPCKNDGICTQHRGFYKCHCKRGYIGQQCMTSLYEHCPKGFIHYPENGHCYYTEGTYENQLNWTHAHELCLRKGATLADLETEEEMRFVASIVIMEAKYHFLGARRNPSGSLYWGNGELLPSDRVDPYRYNFAPVKECIGLKRRPRDVVTLEPLECSAVLPFVCEMDSI